MAWCQHLPMGLGPGTPPMPILGGASAVPLRLWGSSWGGKNRGPFSRPEGLVPDPPLGTCKGKNGLSRTLEGAWNLRPPQPPQFPALPPIVPMWGALYLRGATPPTSLSIPAFPALGGEGRAAEIFIYFLYLFNFFFFWSRE